MQQKGFTLIELLIVLVLIAILGTILFIVIKPEQFFKKTRDVQRKSDLESLSIATDTYTRKNVVQKEKSDIQIKIRNLSRHYDLRDLGIGIEVYFTEALTNSSLKFPSRGDCSNIFFSVDSVPPQGWPSIPTGYTATGTTSRSIDGSGWLPIDFTKLVSDIFNISELPVDPKNGQVGKDVNGNSFVFAYSFACSKNDGYELATKLEGDLELMQNDGGNQDGLYETGPGRKILY